MERYYIWAKNYRKSFTEIMVSYIGGYLASILMSSENGTFIDRIHLLQKVNYINVLSWLAIIIFTIYLCSIKVIGIYLERNNLYTKFSNYIKQNTDPCMQGFGNAGFLSFGQNMVLQPCPNLLEGWQTSDIHLHQFRSDTNSHHPIKEDLENAFNRVSARDKFIYPHIQALYEKTNLSEEFKQYLDEHSTLLDEENNQRRVSLRKLYVGKKSGLYLEFDACYWNQANFFWNKMRNDSMRKSKMIQQVYESKAIQAPTSFCLHLIVETKDNKVLLTTISKLKDNDYATTKAATIGEQLEISDIINTHDYNDDFVKVWIQRAFAEEFNLDGLDYQHYVNEDSFRILSVNLEADIINFSLVCVATLNCTFDEFHAHLSVKSLDPVEIGSIEPLSIAQIPAILASYQDEKQNIQYHPSTYLRLLLYMIHKVGYKNSWRAIEPYLAKK